MSHRTSNRTSHRTKGGRSAASAADRSAPAADQGRYSIGRAAALCGVTPRMIRHYESLGLIPKAARTAGDYRVYTTSDVHVLRFIRRARSLGFAMDEIATLLGLWRNRRRASGEVKRLTLKHIAELDSRIEELQSMRAALSDLAAHCRGDARPECPILDDIGGLPPAARETHRPGTGTPARQTTARQTTARQAIGTGTRTGGART